MPLTPANTHCPDCVWFRFVNPLLTSGELVEPCGLSVVMPAYEELPNLREVLPNVISVLSGVTDLTFEILVVLPVSVSTEEQEAIVGLGAIPVVRGPSDSFGDALRSGFAQASTDSDFVVTLDADGSHDPVTIPVMLAATPGADVVIGSRYVTGGSTDNSVMLRMMSKALNFAYGRVLGIACHDISTNYKLYRREDLSKIYLECRDFDVVEEILFRLKALHGEAFKVVEVPDHFRERKHGETKRRLGPFVVSYLGTLVRLRWQTRRRASS